MGIRKLVECTCDMCGIAQTRVHGLTNEPPPITFNMVSVAMGPVDEYELQGEKAALWKGLVCEACEKNLRKRVTTALPRSPDAAAK